jgi:hypothetical protein
MLWAIDLKMVLTKLTSGKSLVNKHPALMITEFSREFSELWERVAPVMAECARTGISVRGENDYLLIERYGFLWNHFILVLDTSHLKWAEDLRDWSLAGAETSR